MHSTCLLAIGSDADENAIVYERKYSLNPETFLDCDKPTPHEFASELTAWRFNCQRDGEAD